jgi:hypothetical protein
MAGNTRGKRPRRMSNPRARQLAPAGGSLRADEYAATEKTRRTGKGRRYVPAPTNPATQPTTRTSCSTTSITDPGIVAAGNRT